MTDPRTTSGAGRFEVRATATDHFAWVRTRLALERTMMAWQRTAVALIGFGFAIVQYLSHMEKAAGARAAYLPDAPRYLGLALISAASWRSPFRFGSTAGASVIYGANRSRRSPE
jgi:putative membrane protein